MVHHKAGLSYVDDPTSVALAVRTLAKVVYRPRANPGEHIPATAGTHVHIAEQTHVSKPEEILQANVSNYFLFFFLLFFVAFYSCCAFATLRL